MKKTTKLAAAIALALSMSGTANAAVYNISTVLNGTDGGFGFSGFHFAGENAGSSNAYDYDSNAMTGTSLAGIDATPLSGTYNDLTGELNMWLTLSAGAGTVELAGTGFSFDTAGVLSSVAYMDVIFSSPTASLYDTTITFNNSIVCCSGSSPAPNSFDGTFISLWGADFPNPNIGLDLRLELTPAPVPVPAAVWLFGSGLLGLAGLARRKA